MVIKIILVFEALFCWDFDIAALRNFLKPIDLYSKKLWQLFLSKRMFTWNTSIWFWCNYQQHSQHLLVFSQASSIIIHCKSCDVFEIYNNTELLTTMLLSKRTCWVRIKHDGSRSNEKNTVHMLLKMLQFLQKINRMINVLTCSFIGLITHVQDTPTSAIAQQKRTDQQHPIKLLKRTTLSITVVATQILQLTKQHISLFT